VELYPEVVDTPEEEGGVPSRSYTRKLWIRLKRKAAYLPG
jgi:hypothetical protein